MNHKNIFILLAVVCLSAIPLLMAAQGAARDPLRATSSAFFQTDEARHIGDQMLLYQRATGGWPKNVDMQRPLTPDERAQVERDKQRRDDSTIDNGATTTQTAFLARLYQQTGDNRYREAVRRAVDYLLGGQ